MSKRDKSDRDEPASDESGELDPRAAARALKAALAKADAESEDSGPAIKPRRRRRPPTYHGPPAPRPRRVSLIPEEEPDEERPPSWFLRHDVAVLIFGLALLAAGAISHRTQTAPALESLERMGLHLARPAGFLPPIELGPAAPTATAGDGSPLPYHVEYQWPTRPLLRLELLIDERPAFNNLRAARALDRASRFGELVWTRSSDDVKIRGRNWLRTEYVYAFKSHDFDTPRVATAIEFATLNGSLVYAVTAHGDREAAAELAELVSRSLDADANHPAANLASPGPGQRPQ